MRKHSCACAFVSAGTTLATTGPLLAEERITNDGKTGGMAVGCMVYPFDDHASPELNECHADASLPEAAQDIGYVRGYGAAGGWQ
jgi:hypothetical protein